MPIVRLAENPKIPAMAHMMQSTDDFRPAGHAVFDERDSPASTPRVLRLQKPDKDVADLKDVHRLVKHSFESNQRLGLGEQGSGAESHLSDRLADLHQLRKNCLERWIELLTKPRLARELHERKFVWRNWNPLERELPSSVLCFGMPGQADCHLHFLFVEVGGGVNVLVQAWESLYTLYTGKQESGEAGVDYVLLLFFQTRLYTNLMNEELKTYLDARFAKVTTDITSLSTQMSENTGDIVTLVDKRFDTVESRLEILEEKTTPLTNQVSGHEKRIKFLEDRLPKFS